MRRISSLVGGEDEGGEGVDAIGANAPKKNEPIQSIILWFWCGKDEITLKGRKYVQEVFG